MTSLIYTDFRRFIKDKSMIVLMALIVVFAFLTNIVLKVASSSELMQSILPIEYTVEDVVINALSPSSNVGMIVPIIMAIVLLKEYSQGTIRNKIIIGKRRVQIYLSNWIAAMGIGLLAYLLYVILNLFLGMIMFGTGGRLGFGKLLGIVLLSTLVYSVFITAVVLLAVLTRNLGITIVISVIGNLLVSVAANFPDIDGMPKFLELAAHMSPAYQIVNLASSGLSGEMVTLSLLATLGYTVVFGGIGMYCFSKIDLR